MNASIYYLHFLGHKNVYPVLAGSRNKLKDSDQSNFLCCISTLLAIASLVIHKQSVVLRLSLVCVSFDGFHTQRTFSHQSLESGP